MKRMLSAVFVALYAAGPCGAWADVNVKIGFAAPLTGPNAAYGKDLEYGVKLAVEEANAKGVQINGQRAVFELISQDDQADPRVGVQVAQRLIDDGVGAVVGHYNSGTTIPASVLYEKAGIPTISPAASNPTITSRGFSNIFMAITNDGQTVGAAAAYAVQSTRAKRIAIIDDRTAFGQGEADEFEKAVKAAGGNIVAHEFTTNQAVDFRTQLTRIKASSPDLVFVGTINPQAAGIVKQMRALGINSTFVGGGGVMNDDFLKLAGAASEGAFAWEPGRPIDATATGRAFAGRFKQRFGVEVFSYAPFGYDAAWTVIKAMQEAGSSAPDQYRGKLKAISADGITGTIAFKPDGSLKNATATMYEVKGGKWGVVVSRSGL